MQSEMELVVLSNGLAIIIIISSQKTLLLSWT